MNAITQRLHEIKRPVNRNLSFYSQLKNFSENVTRVAQLAGMQLAKRNTKNSSNEGREGDKLIYCINIDKTLASLLPVARKICGMLPSIYALSPASK